ncbi:MAG: tetratricopeptide repeat protein [Planctomycetota bacterium]
MKRLLLLLALALPAAAQDPAPSQPVAPAVKARLRGLDLLKARKYAEALEAFQESLKYDPGDYNTLFHVGQTYHFQGDLKNAVVWYSKTIDALPGHHMAYHNRGVAYTALRELPKALKDLDEAVQLDPRYAQGWHSRAGVFLLLGKDGEAIEDCTQAIARAPKFASAYHTRALARMRLGLAKEAEEDLVKANELVPGVAGWVFHQGVAESRQGKLKPALETIERALAMKAEGPGGRKQRPLDDFLRARAISTRGELRWLLGDTKQGLADELEAAKLTPEHVYSPLWVYALGGEQSELERLAKHDYKEGEDRWVQQIILFYLGRLERAKLLALAESPEDEKQQRQRLCQAYCYEAMLHERAGRLDKAVALYEQTLAQRVPGYSEHWWAEQRLKVLKQK